jgi:hypothetical protein
MDAVTVENLHVWQLPRLLFYDNGGECASGKGEEQEQTGRELGAHKDLVK